jgi:hypothetical protein
MPSMPGSHRLDDRARVPATGAGIRCGTGRVTGPDALAQAASQTPSAVTPTFAMSLPCLLAVT